MRPALRCGAGRTSDGRSDPRAGTGQQAIAAAMADIIPCISEKAKTSAGLAASPGLFQVSVVKSLFAWYNNKKYPSRNCNVLLRSVTIRE